MLFKTVHPDDDVIGGSDQEDAAVGTNTAETTGVKDNVSADVEYEDADEGEASSEPSGDPEQKSEDQYWAEVQLAGSMAEIERERVQLEDEIEEATGAVDAAKEVLSGRESTLSQAKESHREATQRLLALARELIAVSDGKKLPTTTDDPQSTEPAGRDGWRGARTAELIAGSKGVSEKKLSAICEVAPTLGDLEDLRAKASMEHVPFHKLLPKGCGDGVANAIEDKIVVFISDWAKRMDDPDRKALADELVAEVRETASEWLEKDCAPDDSDGEHLHAGFAAFDNSQPHTDFLSEDRALAKQWITGWVMAEKLRELKDAS